MGILELIILILLVVSGVDSVVNFLANHPGSGRVLVGGCGLFLAVFMTVTGAIIWTDPQLDGGMAVLFFMWAGFGVMLMVKAAKEK